MAVAVVAGAGADMSTPTAPHRTAPHVRVTNRQLQLPTTVPDPIAKRGTVPLLYYN